MVGNTKKNSKKKCASCPTIPNYFAAMHGKIFNIFPCTTVK